MVCKLALTLRHKQMLFHHIKKPLKVFFLCLFDFDPVSIKTYAPETIGMNLKRMSVVWKLNKHSSSETSSDSVFSHSSWAPVTWFRHLIRTLPEHVPLDLLWERSNWEEIALRHLNQTQSENDSGTRREAEERPGRSAAFLSILSTRPNFIAFMRPKCHLFAEIKPSLLETCNWIQLGS